MALLFIEGFDHTYNTSELKWDYLGTHFYDTANPRTGLRCISTNGTVVTKYFSTTGGFVVGIAIRNNGAWNQPPFPIDMIQIREGGIVHLVLRSSPGNAAPYFLQVARGLLTGSGPAYGNVLGTGTTPLLTTDVWEYFEFRGVIADVGWFEVRRNGVLEPGLSVSGVNTKNGGTGAWNRLGVEGWTHRFDDLYLCDQGGSTHNTFLGNARVETLLPVKDTVQLGTYRAWVPANDQGSGLADHGQICGGPDGYGFYWLRASATGAKESFQFPPRVYSSSAISAIQTTVQIRRSDTPERTYRQFLRVGTDVDGPDVLPIAGGTPTGRSGQFQPTGSSAWGSDSVIWTTNPLTGLPWTDAEIAVLEAGVRITS